MASRLNRPTTPADEASPRNVAFDLDALLHPAQTFSHPSKVLNDPDLTLNEKRAVLASLASDACAVEATPELRMSPAGSLVRFDDIMDALRALDRQAGPLDDSGRYRRFRPHRKLFGRRGRDDQSDQGFPFC